jgi:DeoR/GlpR family transcriptional regulator of sugar metabolism
MLAIERHRRLLDLLDEHGSLRTAQVALAMSVTEETVRRDFEKLEADGALLRSHGGAVRLDLMRREFSASERIAQNASEKIKIAKAAVNRIKTGQTILLDASTTVLQVARLLPDQSLSVLTNALQIALVLADKLSIDVTVLGGNFVKSSQSCTGLAAEQILDQTRVDTAYISCRGFDADRGPSEATEEQACLKRRIVACADEVCLLSDGSKNGVSSSFFFAKPADIDLWITDRQPSQAFKTALAASGVRILVASK